MANLLLIRPLPACLLDLKRHLPSLKHQQWHIMEVLLASVNLFYWESFFLLNRGAGIAPITSIHSIA